MLMSTISLKMELPAIGLSALVLWSFYVFFLTSTFSLVLGGNNNDTDSHSLLAIKAQILDDPLGILNSWNGSRHMCEWQGITCGNRHRRVTVLDLHSSQLKGLLSPHIGNLSFLRTLNLKNNSFTHNIPPQIGHLFRLRNLNLANNSFNGQIPLNISSCSDLQLLNLAGNNLTGKLPNNVASLTKLQVLDLYSNNFVGEIPASFGNLSSLKIFSLEKNGLHGSIPNSFGRLKSLTYFSLGANNLSGSVPSSIYNLSSIQYFSVYMNQLHGSLPIDLGHTLPNLETLLLHTNQFSGSIPVSISNASNLLDFQISYNSFTGKVPSLASLSKLYWLGMALNNLGHGEYEDLNFLSSLVNCTNLEILDIGDNKFGGLLPESVSNFSIKIRILVIGGNGIQGSIPIRIGNLISLETISFEANQLTGSVPSSIGELQDLNTLYLNNNGLSGSIPSSLGNLTSLGTLYLDVNDLQGNIPPSLGGCKNLLSLGLSLNNLSGSIPVQVLGWSSLSKDLDLSRNNLIGSIPMEVGNLVNLGYLDLSNNLLSGRIPETLGKCLSLENLYLDHNHLEGPIPQSFGSLRGTEEIDLSSNNLSGKIPLYLEGFRFIQNLNLSFNYFEGEVPMKGIFNNASAFSVIGNTRLCGGISQLKLPRCTTSNLHDLKKHKHFHQVKLIIFIACGVFVALLISMLLIVLFYQSRKNRSKSSSSGLSSTISFLQVSYGDLLKATDGFSLENLVGAGSFGSVYKGILNQEERILLVAVKVLNLQNLKATKSFNAECKALINIRHRNLVKLLTVCSSIDFRGNDFKALVYEFMVNGNVEDWLHPEDGHRHLKLMQRLNIAIDVASALDYLHNQCSTPIVHCDLKPSNILLDSDMTARVGDFGLARFLPINANSSPFLLNEASSSIGLKGSIGYAAPEYGMGSDASALGDVYSYGILLLEMFTGKRPTDAMFKDGMNLHNFALEALAAKHVEEIFDPMLGQSEGESSNINNSKHNRNRGDHNHKRQRNEECMISIVKIGIACSVDLPSERMDIAQAVAQLCHIRNALL